MKNVVKPAIIEALGLQHPAASIRVPEPVGEVVAFLRTELVPLLMGAGDGFEDLVHLSALEQELQAAERRLAAAHAIVIAAEQLLRVGKAAAQHYFCEPGCPRWLVACKLSTGTGWWVGCRYSACFFLRPSCRFALQCRRCTATLFLLD